MKKLFTSLVASILVFTLLLSIGCAKPLAMGKEMLKSKTQLEAVTQLDKGEVDAVVIDSIMAGYYAVQGDYAGKIAIVPNLILAEEEYGIAGRKGDKAFIGKINEALIELNTSILGASVLGGIASAFGVQESLAVKEDSVNPYADATDDSWDKIKTSKKIVIGYTLFAPIAYKVAGSLTGFDIELAKTVVHYLNEKYNTEIEIEFLEIDWNSKEALLEEGSIDLVWNGMTITEERLNAMCISIPYLYNRQVAVTLVENVSKYTDKASFKDAVIGVEAGSAGEKVVAG